MAHEQTAAGLAAFFAALEATPGGARRIEYDAFRTEHAAWLDDFALFMAAKDAHGGVAWNQWEPALAAREPKALEQWRKRLAKGIAEHTFWQFEFFRQWNALRADAGACVPATLIGLLSRALLKAICAARSVGLLFPPADEVSFLKKRLRCALRN